MQIKFALILKVKVTLINKDQWYKYVYMIDITILLYYITYGQFNLHKFSCFYPSEKCGGWGMQFWIKAINAFKEMKRNARIFFSSLDH